MCGKQSQRDLSGCIIVRAGLFLLTADLRAAHLCLLVACATTGSQRQEIFLGDLYKKRKKGEEPEEKVAKKPEARDVSRRSLEEEEERRYQMKKR